MGDLPKSGNRALTKACSFGSVFVVPPQPFSFAGYIRHSRLLWAFPHLPICTYGVPICSKKPFFAWAHRVFPSALRIFSLFGHIEHPHLLWGRLILSFWMALPEYPSKHPSGAKGKTPIHNSNAFMGTMLLPCCGIPSTAEPKLMQTWISFNTSSSELKWAMPVFASSMHCTR